MLDQIPLRRPRRVRHYRDGQPAFVRQPLQGTFLHPPAAVVGSPAVDLNQQALRPRVVIAPDFQPPAADRVRRGSRSRSFPAPMPAGIFMASGWTGCSA
jgi:hypothetical protein